MSNARDNALTGVQRAAVLLLSLGEEDAAEVLKHMNAKEVQKLGIAMATISGVSREQVMHVISNFGEALCKLQEQQLSTVLEHNCTPFKLHICFYFIAVFQKLLGMFGFKIKVMIVGARRKADFFYLALLGVGFHFFFLTLLLVQEFIIIDDFTNGRVGLR